MKKRLLKFTLPIVLGIALVIISLIGITGCEPVCSGNELAGTNGDCMYCPGGNVPSYNYWYGCSNINNGVYCCP
jgi:hypothetical protein